MSVGTAAGLLDYLHCPVRRGCPDASNSGWPLEDSRTGWSLPDNRRLRKLCLRCLQERMKPFGRHADGHTDLGLLVQLYVRKAPSMCAWSSFPGQSWDVYLENSGEPCEQMLTRAF